MAVASLQNQSFQNWELLILDNASTEDSWNIVTQVTDKDARIEAFRNEENVGWAKGTSLLLPKAKGEYVTFLAADDFINDETLGDLAVKLEKEKPDIAFVGNAFLEVKDDLSIRVLGGNCPRYCLYGPENRSECIVEILKTVYFNSMFHYCRTSFLDECGIDFFTPYYGDCGGMTEGLCRANKIMTYDRVVYLLSMNTSQTYGMSIWDYYKVTSGQWKSLSEVFERENYSEEDNVRFVAEKIFDNYLSHLDILMNNGNCRDRYMNPIEVSQEKKIQQVRDLLNDEYMNKLLDFLHQERLKKALEDECIRFETEGN